MKVSGIIGGTIRSRLLLVVIIALVPVTLLSAWQSQVSYTNARVLVIDRLRANAAEIAESERDPFIIARHALAFASESKPVTEISSQCSDALRVALYGADGILNFLRTDANGRARCSALPFEPGKDMSKDRWWLEARGKSGTVLSSPQIGSISKRPVLIMVRNLQTADGRFDGTVSAGISIERLAESLQRKRADQPGAVIVTDGMGVPILQSPQNAFKIVPLVGRAREEPLETIGTDQRKWTYVSAPLFGDQLYAVYAEPSRSVMGAQVISTRSTLAMQLLALLATSLAIWFASQRLILRWLSKLNQLAARFAQGDFSGEQEAYANAPEEIAALAGGLHEMAAAVDKQQRDLRAALEIEKELTREVHHRVNNNLQIVTSLLALQGERVVEPALRDIVGLARTRISALGLIHRLLYNDSSKAERGTVNLHQLFADLCAHLRAANRDMPEVSLDCTAPDRAATVDQAVPLTLFVVEAVTNAFRHAFDPLAPGAIDTRLEIEDNIAELTVHDTGKGLLEGDLKTGMGFDLMNAFTVQLGGTMETSKADPGTRIILRFPLQSRGF
jgi:two-component sensor histidine kinase